MDGNVIMAKKINKFFGLPKHYTMQDIMDTTSGNPCVLAGDGCEMTWNSFATACLWRQAKNKLRNPLCGSCKIGKAIKDGRKVSPPDGIKIIKPDGWTEKPISYPPKYIETLAKYRFYNMEVGETVEYPIELKKRCMSSKRQITIRHGKSFDTKIIGDKIQFTRTK